MRFVLGIAEAANFPASIKAVGMWFPQKERALATGIFNSGTSVGVMVSFGTVWIAEHRGWQVGLRVHRRHGPDLAGLLAEVLRRAGKTPALRASGTRIHQAGSCPHRKGGEGSVDSAVALSRNLAVHHRQIHHRSGVVVLPILAAVVPGNASAARIRSKSALLGRGDLHRLDRRFDLGGWLSGELIKRGWPVGKARMTTMGLAAIFMPGSILAYYADSFAACVAFITLATACHQAWSANLFTNATDMFPRKVPGRWSVSAPPPVVSAACS